MLLQQINLGALREGSVSRREKWSTTEILLQNLPGHFTRPDTSQASRGLCDTLH